MKDKRTEQGILADIRKELLGLEQQAMTSNQVQPAIWKLWGFVRDNQNSLESERCCRAIQEIVNGAVMDVTGRAVSAAVELDTTQQELKDSKKEVKRLIKELEESLKENVNLKSMASEPKDEVENHPDAA